MKLKINRKFVYEVNKEIRQTIVLSWAELVKLCGDNNLSLVVSKTKEFNVESGTRM